MTERTSAPDPETDAEDTTAPATPPADQLARDADRPREEFVYRGAFPDLTDLERVEVDDGER